MNYLPYKNIEPENENLYDNGTPFDKPELIYKYIEGSISYLKDKQPIVNVIIGGQSTGKTTLSTHLTDIYNYYYNKTIMDLKQDGLQHSQTHAEFLHKLPKCAREGYPSHTWDDSGKYSRKNSLTRDNKIIDEAMDVVRVHQTAINLIRHDISRIPKELIEHEIVTILIRCKKRKPGSKYVEAEVYDFESICWIIYYMKQAVAPQYIFNKKVYPNFHFRYKDLSTQRSAELDKLSSKKKQDMWDQKDIKAQGLLTIEEIRYQIGMSKIWIKKKILELKIKPKMEYKKKHYYNNEIIQPLLAQIKKRKN